LIYGGVYIVGRYLEDQVGFILSNIVNEVDKIISCFGGWDVS